MQLFSRSGILPVLESFPILPADLFLVDFKAFYIWRFFKRKMSSSKPKLQIVFGGSGIIS